MVPFSYSLRNIRGRAHVTVAASFGVALVVFVLASAAMLRAGLSRMLEANEAPEDAIVLAVGAVSEIESSFPVEKARSVAVLSQVATDASGPIVSYQQLITLTLPSAKDGVPVNALIRGVDAQITTFHPRLTLIAGRRPAPDVSEAMVGRSIVGRFKNVDVGDTIKLGARREFKIVGIFADGGSSAESEIWINLDAAQSAFYREGGVASAYVRLKSVGDFDAFRNQIEHEPRLRLRTETRRAFNAKQSEMLSLLIAVLGGVISGFFGVSAVLGASVSIYSSVASRIREFGTLRALGFSRSNVLMAVLFESVILTLIGGAFGALASLLLRGQEFSFLGPNWGQVVFRFELTPMILLNALLASFVAGVLGGMFPALRASRISPTAALRGG